MSDNKMVIQFRYTEPDQSWSKYQEACEDGSFSIDPDKAGLYIDGHIHIQARVKGVFIPGYYRLKDTYRGEHPNIVWANYEANLSGGLKSWERVEISKAEDD